MSSTFKFVQTTDIDSSRVGLNMSADGKVYAYMDSSTVVIMKKNASGIFEQTGIIPSSNGYGTPFQCCIHPSGEYVAITHTSNSVASIWRVPVVGNPTFLKQFKTFDTGCSNYSAHIEYSQGGTLMAVYRKTYVTSGGFGVMMIDGETYTKITEVPDDITQVFSVAMNDANRYVAACTGSMKLFRINSSFKAVSISLSGLGQGSIRTCAFNSKYLFVNVNPYNASYPGRTLVYRMDGGTVFTKLSATLENEPYSVSTTEHWSAVTASENHVVICYMIPPFINVYNIIDNDMFTPCEITATSAICTYAYFIPSKSDFLVVGNNDIEIYYKYTEIKGMRLVSSEIRVGDIDPTVIISVLDGMFLLNAELLSNWDIDTGSTQLMPIEMSDTNDGSIKLKFLGTASEGQIIMDPSASILLDDATLTVTIDVIEDTYTAYIENEITIVDPEMNESIKINSSDINKDGTYMIITYDSGFTIYKKNQGVFTPWRKSRRIVDSYVFSDNGKNLVVKYLTYPYVDAFTLKGLSQIYINGTNDIHLSMNGSDIIELALNDNVIWSL